MLIFIKIVNKNLRDPVFFLGYESKYGCIDTSQDLHRFFPLTSESKLLPKKKFCFILGKG